MDYSGTPNKPKSVKIAMREFTDEEGDTLLAWARDLLYDTPNFVVVSEKVVSLVNAKMQLFKLGLEYGIGTPNKQVKDGGHHTLTIQPRFPLGVDPMAMREAQEADEVRQGLRKPPPAAEGVRAGVARPVGPRPMSALMRASVRCRR